MANVGIKDVECMKTGHVSFANPEKMGVVAKPVEEHIDKNFGGDVKRVSTL